AHVRGVTSSAILSRNGAAGGRVSIAPWYPPAASADVPSPRAVLTFLLTASPSIGLEVATSPPSLGGNVSANAAKDRAAEVIRDAKERAGLTWADIAEAIDRPREWTISALLGNHPVPEAAATRVGELLD